MNKLIEKAFNCVFGEGSRNEDTRSWSEMVDEEEMKNPKATNRVVREVVDVLTAMVPQAASENEFQEDEERDYGVIHYRDDVYVHASGMIFDTEEKRY